jgi:DNA invertase Pin-like site-specific DNA recombinase
VTLVGYGRPSGTETSPEPQLAALRELGAEETFVDLARLGRIRARPELDACLARLEPGDVLVVTGLVRLSRSIEHVVDLISELHQRGITLRSVAENLDTAVAVTPGEFATMLADVNAGIVRENTLAGLARAERSGRRPGRPPAMTAEQIDTAARLRAQGESWRDVATAVGIPHSTVRRTLTSVGAHSRSD